MQINIQTIIFFFLRVGLMLFAFYLGTKYFLISNNFANFAMYAIYRECREKHNDCKNCIYYSERCGRCSIREDPPHTWKMTHGFFKIKRKDI